MKKRSLLISISFAFALVTNAQLRISDKGMVGVGGITPTEQFHVLKQATTNGNNVISTFERTSSATGGSGIVRLNVGPSIGELQINSGYSNVNQEYGNYFDFNIVNKSNNPTYGSINFVTNNKIRMSIRNDGVYAINIYGSLIRINSDIRLKRNVIDLSEGVNTVMKFHPVSYDKKSALEETEYNIHEYGFIAQEVQKILPTLVSKSSDESKILSVNYFAIIPILTKAIQEQQDTISSLQTQLDELNKKVDALLKRK